MNKQCGCGSQYEAKTDRSKYCSTRCRMKAFRDKVPKAKVGDLKTEVIGGIYEAILPEFNKIKEGMRVLNENMKKVLSMIEE